ncbi:peptidase S8 [Aquimarina sp. BL5]|uniref:S8 family serine peptidase n=1 Tax=Aquimarina sp. BL5 TaxID=1714860 RepID=UPI000E4947CE|nr:S8 family serine peptidase [Aquimarina sp. BL5]AXT51313.1 peptidase S8 [Aquimarina sp. BL5]RKM93368.1 peptidase S8 [Aquimarina sp. BL5]
MKKILKLTILIFLGYQCPLAAQTTKASSANKKGLIISKTLSKEELKTWYHKDFAEDTIPGVSLEKAYREIIKDNKGQEVIVAVLDTKLDIHHEDLKDQIWRNTDEIPDNGIDDDKNGYIDDSNGWDFLSNTKSEFVKYEHLESTRIVKKYNTLFKGKKANQVSDQDQKSYGLYTKAYKKWESDIVENKESQKNIQLLKDAIIYGTTLLDSIYPKKEYKLVELDSLLQVYENDSIAKNAIEGVQKGIRYDLTPKGLDVYISNYKNREETILRVDHNERAVPGDNPDDINDNHYGSPVVYGDVPFQHATAVAGTLGANRSNDLGIKGFSDHIKIMPVVMVATGDEHDKDVALAIRYAVDNGAKVINMSWGKTLSLHEDWVQNAIRYAAEKDVLLITGGGNNNMNNDLQKSYPNDYTKEKEFVDNFIVVGASTWDLQNLRASFSNYGKKHVDVFAPGVDMYTTKYGNDAYTSTRGTSLASPVVAGIAALIRAYYPKLSAKEVKQVILDSGTRYDFDVVVRKQKDEGSTMVPFSELSKSGRIVNAYSALLLADQISKTKK